MIIDDDDDDREKQQQQQQLNDDKGFLIVNIKLVILSLQRKYISVFGFMFFTFVTKKKRKCFLHQRAHKIYIFFRFHGYQSHLISEWWK